MDQVSERCGIRLDDALDPLVLFTCWMDDAKVSELNDPNAMSLATATPDGIPSVRIVLLKRFDERGFTFYTNSNGRKGRELRNNDHAALCLHWKSRQRQVRIEGGAAQVSDEDADGYFKQRHRMSQIGAWASRQSQPLASRGELLAETARYEAQFPDAVPRPPYWTGFRVAPRSIEFWQEGDYRLHDRFVFTRGANDGWAKQRLNP